MARKRFRSSDTDARPAPKRAVTDGPFAETKELLVGTWVKPDEPTRKDESELELITTGEFRTPGEPPE